MLLTSWTSSGYISLQLVQPHDSTLKERPFSTSLPVSSSKLADPKRKKIIQKYKKEQRNASSRRSKSLLHPKLRSLLSTHPIRISHQQIGQASQRGYDPPTTPKKCQTEPILKQKEWTKSLVFLSVCLLWCKNPKKGENLTSMAKVKKSLKSFHRRPSPARITAI